MSLIRRAQSHDAHRAPGATGFLKPVQGVRQFRTGFRKPVAPVHASERLGFATYESIHCGPLRSC